MIGVSEGVSCFSVSSTSITFSTSRVSSMSVGTTTSGCFFFSTSSSESEEDELDEDEEMLRSLLNIPVIFSVTSLSEGVGSFGTSSTTTTSLSSELEEDEEDTDSLRITSSLCGTGLTSSFSSSESELDEELL